MEIEGIIYMPVAGSPGQSWLGHLEEEEVFMATREELLEGKGYQLDGAPAAAGLCAAGRHARSAVGITTLPLGASVEVEMILAVE